MGIEMLKAARRTRRSSRSARWRWLGPAALLVLVVAGLVLPGSALAIVPRLEALLGTTTAITAPGSGAYYGQAQTVDLAATVSPSAASGTVMFRFSQVTSQTNNPTACTARLSGGTGSCSASSLGLGTHTMWASYSGDATYAASDSSTITVTISAPPRTAVPTRFTVSGSPNPSVPNQRVTISAAASADGPIYGDLWFQEDGVASPLCPPTPLVGAGTAATTCSATFTSAGEHTISARYCPPSSNPVGSPASVEAPIGSIQVGPDGVRRIIPAPGGQGATTTAGGHPAGQGVITTPSGLACINNDPVGPGGAGYTQSVQNQPDSTVIIVLAAAPNPASSGEAIAFTAAVGGSVGIPTGTVSLRENGLDIGCTITLVSSRGTCNRSLSAGTHTIIASYRGDGAFGPSTSQPLTVTVNAAERPAAQAVPRSGQATLPSGETANVSLSTASAALLQASAPGMAGLGLSVATSAVNDVPATTLEGAMLTPAGDPVHVAVSLQDANGNALVGDLSQLPPDVVVDLALPVTVDVVSLLPGSSFTWLAARYDETGAVIGFTQPPADVDPVTGQVTLHLPAVAALGGVDLLPAVAERPGG